MVVHLLLVALAPLVVGTQDPQGVEVVVVLQMLLARYARVRFFPVAQKEYPKEAPAVAIALGSCPDHHGPLPALDVRCEVPSAGHVESREGNLQNVDHRRGRVPDGLGDLKVSGVIVLLVEDPVDPALDVHGSIQRGQDASVDMVVDQLVVHGVHARRRAFHQRHQVQGANVQVGPASRALEAGPRDNQGHGMVHLEAALSVVPCQVGHNPGDHPHQSGQGVGVDHP